jgi:hypothetical protein
MCKVLPIFASDKIVQFEENNINLTTYDGSENLAWKMLPYCNGFVYQVNLTTQPQPFGEGHEGKIPKGADLSLQGVCTPLGGFCILIRLSIDKAKSSTSGQINQ